jgi:predicted RNase H-like nuclease
MQLNSNGKSNHLREDKPVEGLHRDAIMAMDRWKGRHLHQAMCAAAAEFLAISFNIAHKKARHLHLAIPASDAGFQDILFSIAQPLVIPNLTIIKCLVPLPQ